MANEFGCMFYRKILQKHENIALQPCKHALTSLTWRCERVHLQVRIPRPDLEREQGGHPGAQAVSCQHQAVARIPRLRPLQGTGLPQPPAHVLRPDRHPLVRHRVRRETVRFETVRGGGQVGEDVAEGYRTADRDHYVGGLVVGDHAEG